MPTLSKLTPAAAAVIVGVAILLSVLVYLKVDGASMAAIAYASALVALFTKAQKPEAPTPAGDPSEAQDGPSPPKDEAH